MSLSRTCHCSAHHAHSSLPRWSVLHAWQKRAVGADRSACVADLRLCSEYSSFSFASQLYQTCAGNNCTSPLPPLVLGPPMPHSSPSEFPTAPKSGSDAQQAGTGPNVSGSVTDSVQSWASWKVLVVTAAVAWAIPFLLAGAIVLGWSPRRVAPESGSG